MRQGTPYVFQRILVPYLRGGIRAFFSLFAILNHLFGAVPDGSIEHIDVTSYQKRNFMKVVSKS